MRSDEESNAQVDRQLGNYKDLRTRLNLPLPANDDESRQRLFSREAKRICDETLREELDDERKRQREAWLDRVLARHEDVTIVARKDEVFSQAGGGEQTPIPPPYVPFELNEMDPDLDLNTISKPIVVDKSGYAWTRYPALAFFCDDGSRLTIQWLCCGHEQKYGWEYSHGITQRVTWGRVFIDGMLSWNWMETIEREGICWVSSTEQWKSLCTP